jgi:hypothetical protein
LMMPAAQRQCAGCAGECCKQHEKWDAKQPPGDSAERSKMLALELCGGESMRLLMHVPPVVVI